MNKKKNIGEAFIFLLPAISIIVIFVILPICVTFTYSLMRYKMTFPDDIAFIGFDNYKAVLADSLFWDSLANTFVIMLVVIILGFAISMSISLLLNKNFRLNSVLTTIAIIPWALPPIVNGIVWEFIFDSDNGLIFKVLSLAGLVEEPLRILTGRFSSLTAIGIILAWRVIPFCSVLFLANLKAISPDIYEAARVDGAGRFKTFIFVTLPLLMPSAMIVFTNLTMNSLNVFDEVVSLVGYREMGSPLLIYNYNETFSYLNFGFGSSITYTIMILSGIIGYFYIKSMNPVKNEVHSHDKIT